jgi:hypothetical protein
MPNLKHLVYPTVKAFHHKRLIQQYILPRNFAISSLYVAVYRLDSEHDLPSLPVRVKERQSNL